MNSLHNMATVDPRNNFEFVIHKQIDHQAK